MSGIQVSGPMFEPARHGFWESMHGESGGHYNTFGLAVEGMTRDDLGMDALRELFPAGEADEYTLCLFSTSGVHGSYTTIEEAESPSEEVLGYWEAEHPGEPYVARVTFLVLHPRVVTTRHGNCHPKTPDDFTFLKKLRQSSWNALASIGRDMRRTR